MASRYTICTASSTFAAARGQIIRHSSCGGVLISGPPSLRWTVISSGRCSQRLTSAGYGSSSEVVRFQRINLDSLRCRRPQQVLVACLSGFKKGSLVFHGFSRREREQAKAESRAKAKRAKRDISFRGEDPTDPSIVMQNVRRAYHNKNCLMAQEMLEAGLRLPEIEPITLYNAVLDVFAISGAWEEAVATMERMRKTGTIPDHATFDAVMEACNASNQWEKVLELMEEMQAYGSRPTIRNYIYAIRASGLGRQVDRGLQFLEQMKADDIQPDALVYATVIEMCGNSGEPRLVVGILGQMLKEGIEADRRTYDLIMKFCANDEVLMRAAGDILWKMDT